MARDDSPSRLRSRRLRTGLSQIELAQRAQVSRQLVAAVEAGRNVPSVDAALGLARALGVSVEALFGGREDTHPTVVLGGAGRGPVRVGRVGDALVAAELADRGTAGLGWASADAVLESGAVRMLSESRPAGFVIAGCDPALGVAEALLGDYGPERTLAVSAGSRSALRWLRAGLVHAAVVHGPETGRTRTVPPFDRFHLARWAVGLSVPKTADAVSLESLLGGSLPLIQREAGAAAQQALLRGLRRFGRPHPQPFHQVGSHVEAARLSALLGAPALTIEPAAQAFGLAFHALEHHTVEVWLDPRWRHEAAAEAFLDLLTRSAFSERVAGFGGYELAGCGSTIG